MLNISFFIGKNYRNFSLSENLKPKDKVIFVQTSDDGVITKVRHNVGKPTHPRVYTVRDISEECKTLGLYQTEGRFCFLSGLKMECFHRDVFWYNWRACSPIEVTGYGY